MIPARPSVGHSVWSETHGNGEVINIAWRDDREVTVYFSYWDVREVYEWNEFTYYHERTNQWRVMR